MVSNSIRFFGLMFSFLLILNSFVAALEIRSGSVADALCPRDTGLFTDFVMNTGKSSSGFSVNTQGAADVWSTSVPTGFSLGSGEQKVVYTYVTPGKNAVPGTYSLDVIISGGSESKTISHPVFTTKSVNNPVSLGHNTSATEPDLISKAITKLFKINKKLNIKPKNLIELLTMIPF